MTHNISIIGLGKLGACMVAAYAECGHQVTGVDINKDFVDKINVGVAPVAEKDLSEFIKRNNFRLKATGDYVSTIKESSITFIIVPTPTDSEGGFSVDYVLTACKDIGEGIKQKDDYHLVVLTSTVLPGDCESKIIPQLEKYSGKKCGQDFGFCYSPEFIAIGTVIRDLLSPDFFLIGERDQQSGAMLEDFYKTISPMSLVRRMSIPSAELSKISINSFLTMKITFGNMLAEVSDNIPGANVDDVSIALGSDSRIGSKYLRGGLGYGGPCFPRDNRAFAIMAKRVGVSVPYAQATDDYNKTIISRAVLLIRQHAAIQDKVAVLGLSYKPGTAFSEESQALQIAKVLRDDGYEVLAHNPDGNEHALELMGDDLNFYDDLSDCISQADVLFLSNFDVAFQGLPRLLFDSHVKTVIDPWRQLQVDLLPENINYHTFGIGKK